MHASRYELKTELDPRPGQTTVWYDGSCPLCRREIALLRRLNTEDEVRFCNLDEALDSTLPAPRAHLLARFHVQGPDAKLIAGAAGFVEMWRALPLLRPLAAVAGNRFLLALLERFYLVFLSLRPLLQRLMFWLESRHSKAPAAARRQSAP